MIILLILGKSVRLAVILWILLAIIMIFNMSPIVDLNELVFNSLLLFCRIDIGVLVLLRLLLLTLFLLVFLRLLFRSVYFLLIQLLALCPIWLLDIAKLIGLVFLFIK